MRRGSSRCVALESYPSSMCCLCPWYPMVQSANYVRTELPIRIAHRLRDMQALPYVVVTQEGVAKVYEVRVLVLAVLRARR